jgi:flagellar basal-body rod protein FlgB
MNGLSLLDALTAKMRWHQQRQDLLSQNVANADTPNYKGQELKPLVLRDDPSHLMPAPVSPLASDPRFFPTLSDDGSGDAAAEPQNNFEVTPEGNGVTLEDEMMKVTANQMDYQAATTLYSKSLGLIRTALGRG